MHDVPGEQKSPWMPPKLIATHGPPSGIGAAGSGMHTSPTAVVAQCSPLKQFFFTKSHVAPNCPAASTGGPMSSGADRSDAVPLSVLLQPAARTTSTIHAARIRPPVCRGNVHVVALRKQLLVR